MSFSNVKSGAMAPTSKGEVESFAFCAKVHVLTANSTVINKTILFVIIYSPIYFRFRDYYQNTLTEVFIPPSDSNIIFVILLPESICENESNNWTNKHD